MEIPLLQAKDIDCRISSAYKTKTGATASLVLYKDARVDMRILDEMFGPMGWQRTHKTINNRLFCGISAWDDGKKQWVEKEDVGVESTTQKEKGQASDAFKRAGTNWGIGRELYTAPSIRVDLSEKEYALEKDKVKVEAWAKFFVYEISYSEDRRIDRLVILDNKGVDRYIFGEKEKHPSSGKYAPNVYDDQLNELRKAIKCMAPDEKKREEACQKRYNKPFMQLVEAELREVLAILESKGAKK